MTSKAVEACGTFTAIGRPRARRPIMANPPQPSTRMALPCAALGLINAAPSHNQAGPNLSVAPQNIGYPHG
jgi:hypothetical protein